MAKPAVHPRILQRSPARGMASKVEKGWAPQVATSRLPSTMFTIAPLPPGPGTGFRAAASGRRSAAHGHADGAANAGSSLTGNVAPGSYFPVVIVPFRRRSPAPNGSAFYGQVLRNGAIYEGEHTAMINMDESARHSGTCWPRISGIRIRASGCGCLHRASFNAVCGCRITAERCGKKARRVLPLHHRRASATSAAFTEHELERQRDRYG